MRILCRLGRRAIAFLSPQPYLNVKYLFCDTINMMLFLGSIPRPIFDRFAQLAAELRNRIFSESRQNPTLFSRHIALHTNILGEGSALKARHVDLCYRKLINNRHTQAMAHHADKRLRKSPTHRIAWGHPGDLERARKKITIWISRIDTN